MAGLSARPDGRAALTERAHLYSRVLGALVGRGLLRPDMSILVAAAGGPDRDAFDSLGFTDVNLTNLSSAPEEDYAPYRWETRDLEDFGYPDGSFDWAVVSAGLHHCRSPHRGLLELYRVSRRGLIAIESRDSLAMRTALRLGITEPYEVASVVARGMKAGGVRDSAIPNYVYRWTEREVRKTIASYAPEARHQFLFFHALEIPMDALSIDRRRRTLGRILKSAEPLLRAGASVFSRQGNLLAFVVLKPALPRDLQPWLRLDEGVVAVDEERIGSTYAL